MTTITRWIVRQINSFQVLRVTPHCYRETRNFNEATLFESESAANDAINDFRQWLDEKARLTPLYEGHPWSSWRGGLNVVDKVTFTRD